MIPNLSVVNSFRLEFRSSGSNKFYQGLRMGGDEWQITYGPIGALGTSLKYGEATAQQKVNEKVKKGYIVVTSMTKSKSFQDIDIDIEVSENDKKFMKELENL